MRRKLIHLELVPVTPFGQKYNSWQEYVLAAVWDTWETTLCDSLDMYMVGLKHVSILYALKTTPPGQPVNKLSSTMSYQQELLR